MAYPRSRSMQTDQEEREAYFAGHISADEYLRRTLSVDGPEESLGDQFRRILQRLSKGRGR